MVKLSSQHVFSTVIEHFFGIFVGEIFNPLNKKLFSSARDLLIPSKRIFLNTLKIHLQTHQFNPVGEHCSHPGIKRFLILKKMPLI